MKPPLSLAVQYACTPSNLVLPARAQLRRWVSSALRAASSLEASAPLASATLTIRFVDEEEGRQLNFSYRSQPASGQMRDYATNVLSFPYAPPPLLAGDLVICPVVVQREAAEQGKPILHHFAHLVIHGTLHLLGYDHESDAQAQHMESEEARILSRFRIPDPYLTPA